MLEVTSSGNSVRRPWVSKDEVSREAIRIQDLYWVLPLGRTLWEEETSATQRLQVIAK